MKKSQKNQRSQKSQIPKKKMTTKNKSCNSCRCISLLVFASAALWIYYDVNKHGSWNDSCTSKALNRTGVYNYTNLALDCAHQGSRWLHDRIEEQLPGFSAKADEMTAPYVELCCHLHKLGCNIAVNMKDSIITKVPVIWQTVDYYAPGLLDTTTQYACATWTVIVDTNNYIFVYLRDRVFVGCLSPENIQSVVLEMASSVYQMSSDGIQCIYDKIQAVLK